MSILDRIKSDMKRFVEDTNQNSITLKITTTDNVVFEIPGLHSKHYLGLDTNMNRVNSKNAHCSFHESTVTELGYSIRNGSGEVSLKRWKVEAPDSTGITKKYIIKEWFPNETTGLIVCILADFQ